VTLLVTLTGCGLFGSSENTDAPVAMRTGHPTFTPTVPATTGPAETPAPSGSQGQSAPVPDAASQGDAKAVINGPLVNARSGPGTEFDIVGELERGNEFDIVGVSPDHAWWQICCIDGSQAWVTSEFVDTLGAVDSAPVVGGQANAVSTPATAGTSEEAAPVTPTTAAVPADSFDLETQEQFSEKDVVRIFLYVYSGNSALDGYSLRVTKDGTQLPVDGASFGGQPAFTWPFQDPRQRFQNFKVEFPDASPQGVWQVQIIDSTGATVGPAATFTLTANDANRELYVRYAKRQ